jgi:hypothetical protein
MPEEKNSVLPFQQAEQAPASQDGLIGIEMAMVRLIAGIARRWERYDIDYLSVSGRLFVKIDHCKEIRSNASLVLGPDIEHLFLSLSFFWTSPELAKAGWRQTENDRNCEDSTVHLLHSLHGGHEISNPPMFLLQAAAKVVPS